MSMMAMERMPLMVSGERLGNNKEHIQAVCTDLSAAYTRAVSEHLPMRHL